MEKNKGVIVFIESDPCFSQFLSIHYIFPHEHLTVKTPPKGENHESLLEKRNFSYVQNER